MSDEKAKSFLDYDYDTFRKQMSEATKLLKEMNEAATAMRWQYNMENDPVWEKFQSEMDIAEGWLSSWLSSWCD